MLGINFDKSLLLILNNDTKNREVLLNFLNSLPCSLRNKLSSVLGKDTQLGIEDYYFEKRLSGVVYFYKLDKVSNCLSIGIHSSKDIDNNDIFLLSLYPCPNDISGNYRLGSLIYQTRNADHIHVWDCDKVSYDLVLQKGDVYLKRFCQYEVFLKSKLDMVNINFNPDVEDCFLINNKYRFRRNASRKK